METRVPADPARLPDDPAVLKSTIGQLLELVETQRRRIEHLEQHVGQLRRAHFGHKSERLAPDQLTLAFAEQIFPAELAPWLQPPVYKAPSRRPGGHGRSPLPKHLRRVKVLHDVLGPEKRCRDCGGDLHEFSRAISEQLEYTPSALVVVEHARPKYACRVCQGNVVIAAAPQAPIEKGLPGPGLLAYVAVSKYDDHLPLYRQQEIFRRHGVDIARSTLSDWVAAMAELLEPIVAEMTADVLRSKRIHTDDTPVPVLDETLDHTRQGRLWVYVGDKAHPQVVFRYTPNREQRWAQEFLKPYRGYLQADAYSGYDLLYRTGRVVEVGCWAHARRKFFDSQETDPPRAVAALGFIRRLYDVEEAALHTTAAERKALRQEYSRPALQAFRAWLSGESAGLLPNSPIGKAFTYAHNQWAALGRYVEDGDLAIDNNAAERALRSVAVGRKNWQFCGSDEGGHRAAILYTLIESAKRAGVEPFAYLRDVVDRVSTHPARAIADLMPFRWKPR
jgi:transposase